MAEDQSQTFEGNAADQRKHMIVLVLDKDCKLVGFEFRKFESGSWALKARNGLGGLSVTVGGAFQSPVGGPGAGHWKGAGQGVLDHPGPHNDNDNANPVNGKVKKQVPPNANQRRAHMTFSASVNDPCCQCGDDLVCYD